MVDENTKAHRDEMRDWFADMVGANNPTSSLDRRLQTQREEFIVLKKDQEDIKGQLNDLGASVQALVVEFKESRKVNYPLLVLLFSLIPFAGGGGLYFISGQIEKSIQPLSTSIVQMQANQSAHDKQINDLAARNNTEDRNISNLDTQAAATTTEVHRMGEEQRRIAAEVARSSSADQASQTDRQQLNSRLTAVEGRQATGNSERKAAMAEIGARLVEIEQQFHALSNIANIQMANQNRINAMLWEKVHPGERYPERDFFPQSIFQNSPQPLGMSGRGP